MSFFIRRLAIFALFLAGLLALPAQGAATNNNDYGWGVGMLDQILSNVPPGQTWAQIDDMQLQVTLLQAWRNQLAGAAQPEFAVGSNAVFWPGGNVYYSFTTNVNAVKQRAFTNAAAEWSLFANVHFFPRTSQANYMLVDEVATLSGGLSAVGVVGPAQTFEIGPTAWNRHTLVHECGHTLGLVHEHQRSDRTNYLSILSNNIASGEQFNFVIYPTSQNHGPYDFLSVMHYAHNAFSTSPNTLDTMVPLPAYSQYYNVMGAANPVLSQSDRSNMAAIYGAAVVPASSVVTNTQDTAPGSLRAAIYYAFDHPGTTVTFNISTNDVGYTNGVFTIQPIDELPGLINATTVDGSTEPGHLNPNGPSIQINGALPIPTSTFDCGFRFLGTNCAVRSLVINGFADSSVRFDGTNVTGNIVSGCYLGIDPTGDLAVTNGYYPVYILNGANGNTIGGTTPAARNVISGSVYQGVFVMSPGTSGNVIAGNYIGLNAAGTTALPNGTPGYGYSGVGIFQGAQSNIIGGTVPGARNVISGNGNQGVVISDAGSTGNVVEGNYIGTDWTGSAGVSNYWSGVQIANGAQNNTVGPSNVISGNGNQGVLISDPGTTGNAVAGNWIGLNAAGSGAVPNNYAGVDIAGGAESNLIGGTSEAARNIISGGANQGVLLQDAGTMFNQVAGNWIGLNPAGTVAIANTWSGVEIYNGPSQNLIGGGPDARNLISGNANYGVDIDTSSSNNLVQGNTIGLDATDSVALPNALGGVLVFAQVTGNSIGGVTAGAGNLIADNDSLGVFISDVGTSNNSVRGNSMYGNSSGPGFYIQNGGNNSPNSPSVSSATVGAAGTTIIGSLSSNASSPYHIDFYASPSGGPAQGRSYLGDLDVMTSAGGSVTFTNTNAPAVLVGWIINATATDSAGNSSQYSGNATVAGPDSVGDGIPNAWRAAHFGGTGTTTNSTNCATCDPDHDGMNNRAEFLAGTDPNNPASALRLATPSVSGTNINVSFPTVKDIPYRIEYKDAVNAVYWYILEDQVLGPGGNIIITDPGAAALPMRFYKVQVFP